MTKDLQKRVIFGGIALLFFIPTVMVGGVFFQIVIGLIAMLGVHELLKMKGLETATFEGALNKAGHILSIIKDNRKLVQRRCRIMSQDGSHVLIERS